MPEGLWGVTEQGYSTRRRVKKPGKLGADRESKQMKGTGYILLALVVVALLFGALLVGERLTTQELTRATEGTTGESVCLIWRPRFLHGDGGCDLDLLNRQGRVIDSVRLGTMDTAFNALQRYGQLDFQGDRVLVGGRRGEKTQEFVVRGGRLRTP